MTRPPLTRPPLTTDQALAVHAEGSVAVVAGAGTGKTHMLAHRYLHHLGRGLSPLEIVAVTFTEKAAAELRSRIRALAGEEMARQAAAAGEQDAAPAGATGAATGAAAEPAAAPEPAAIAWPEALAELEAAQISTLHALAARVCRDHPEAAGVPADFAVLEDLERQLWTADRLEEALAQLPAEVLEKVPFAVLDKVLPALVDDPLGAEAALARDAGQWRELIERERARALAEAMASIDWASHRAVLERSRGADGDKGELARSDCLAAMAAFEAGDAALAVGCVGRFRTNAGSKKAWDETELEAVREALREVKGAIKGASDEGRVHLAWGPADDAWAALLPPLRTAFYSLRSFLDDAKRRARTLDFADLEVHALRALEHEDVRSHYAQRWKAYLVDEFQDTNPVQARILDLLLGAGSAAPSSAAPDGVASGSEDIPVEPQVTVVGDEKQAIYGFRGADAGVFRGYRRRIHGAGGGEVVLEQSFRSHDALMSGFNRVFAAVLGELHQDLQAAREPAGDGPHLRFVPIEKAKGAHRAQRVVAEAHAIAGIIGDLVERGTPIYDKATGTHRPAQYGDVAVLARTWKPFDTYAEVLPALGVPAVHSGGGSLLDTREAKDGIALLRFLADPKDDIALVALLRSPFFAIDDRTLHDLALHDLARAKDKDTPWWEALKGRASLGGEDVGNAAAEASGGLAVLSAEATERLGRALLVLGRLLARKREAAPSRLVQQADEATGYGAVLANLPGARRRLADWRGFAALVRELEHGNEDVFAVARRLRRLVDNEVEVPRPVLHADDAVTLMTVHRAKGLEWPVVVVADLAGNGGNRTPPVLLEPALGVAMKLEDDDGEAVEPCLYTILKARRKEREEAEERRILYVALTRARDRVVLTADRPDGGQLETLGDGLEAAGVVPEIVPYDAASTIIPDPPVPELREEQLLHEGRALWMSERADDALPEGALPEGAPAGPAVTAAVWSEALEVVRTFDGGWLPFMEALRDAGAPAPDPDRMFIELQRDGANTAQAAVAIWPCGDGALAVVPGVTPEARYDVELYRADPNELEPASLQRFIDRLEQARAS